MTTRLMECLESRRLLAATLLDPRDLDSSFPTAADRGYTLVGVGTGGGIVVQNQRGSATAYRVLPGGAIDPNYRIRLANVHARGDVDPLGRAVFAEAYGPNAASFQVRRFTVEGATDAHFGQAGVAILPITDRPARWSIRNLAVDDAGRILVSMTDADQSLTLVRVGADGALDTRFGTGGFCRIGIQDPAARVETLGDGRTFIITGHKVIALDAAGNRMRGYGNRGILVVPDRYRYRPDGLSLSLDATGRVYLALPEPGPNRYPANTAVPVSPDGLHYRSVVRLNTDASLDITWGHDGFASLDTHGDRAFYDVRSLGLDTKGRLYVQSGASVAQLRPDGLLNRKFDFDGVYEIPNYFVAAYAPQPVLTDSGLYSFTVLDGRLTPFVEAGPATLSHGGMLVIAAQENGQAVRVTEAGGQIEVRVGRERFVFRSAAIAEMYIRLSDGDDTLTYSSSRQVFIDAGGGNDGLSLLQGQHTVNTGLGDDTLLAGAGRDEVTNPGGHDTIDFGANRGTYVAKRRYLTTGGSIDGTADLRADPGPNRSVRFNLGTGNDTVRVFSGYASVYDTGGDNRIAISSPQEALVALSDSGRSFVDTGDGNDTITSGGGRLQVRTGAGNDFISVRSGRLYADGGEGNDTIKGNVADDTILGGMGNDILLGGIGTDRLEGGGDDDDLNGGTGADLIFGGDGNDAAFTDDDDDVTGVEIITP